MIEWIIPHDSAQLTKQILELESLTKKEKYLIDGASVFSFSPDKCNVVSAI